MRGSGLIIGELADIKAIEWKGFRVELAKEDRNRWCCQVWNSGGAVNYWADSHSEAIRLAIEGTNRNDFRRWIMGEDQ